MTRLNELTQQFGERMKELQSYDQHCRRCRNDCESCRGREIKDNVRYEITKLCDDRAKIEGVGKYDKENNKRKKRAFY